MTGPVMTTKAAKAFIAATLLAPVLALGACGPTAPDTPNTEVAEDFAARINGGATGSDTQQAPTLAPAPVTAPRENAAEGAFAPGTATDPSAATCGANAMGPFIGMLADNATRSAIMSAASAASEVRFIAAGSDYVRPDPTNPRLNLMLDAQGIIRDARCG